MSEVLVIGAGPAGLMAAGELARAGYAVTLADAMPSPGRKFLMAGKSGLNLTKDEPLGAFIAAYRPLAPQMAAALTAFGPDEVMDWARGLGQEVFTGSSGRVFPQRMKASPLLRAWLSELAGLGVELRRNWRWTGWEGDAACFTTPDGPQALRPAATILALGGASWGRLGSDGRWAQILAGDVAEFRPANMGFRVDWSVYMTRHFGSPVKGVSLIVGSHRQRGEFVVSARGLEGGGIYAISRELRDGGSLALDLFPDLAPDRLRDRLGRHKPGDSLSTRLRRLGLDPVRIALVQEFSRPVPDDISSVLKNLPVRVLGPRPIDEAISTAGGVRFEALDGFMLRSRPGVFAAGEMLDWEAPTGGYLLTGCLATGRAAARQAAGWIQQTQGIAALGGAG